MQSERHFTAGFAATLLVLLFSVTLRALIPVGYMPDAGDDRFHLVVCGPVAPAESGGGTDDDGPAGSASVCAFAAAAAVAGPLDSPPLTRPVARVIVRVAGPAPRDPPTADRTEGPSPPARAPPLSI
jgi:hypothetical protein